MSLIKGSDLIVGIGMENPSARGTFVTPQVFVPGRTPSGINVEVVKALIAETKPGAIKSQGSEVVQRKCGGDLGFNIRSETIGYILKSLLGSCDTSVVSGSINDHLFEVEPNDPQYPTISVALSQAGSFQDYAYNGVIVTGLDINIPVDDLINAKITVMGLDEAEHAAFTPSFASTDYYFRPQDVAIKLATNVAGLGAASAINFKEFSLSIKNNGKGQQHIGSVTPTDMIASPLEITGNLKLDYQDDTYHDIYKNGTYKAAQITLTRSDIDLGSGNNPTITIILDRISFEAASPDRPIDDIVKDGFDFTAHYDETNEEAINITVRNTFADYDYDVVT